MMPPVQEQPLTLLFLCLPASIKLVALPTTVASATCVLVTRESLRYSLHVPHPFRAGAYTSTAETAPPEPLQDKQILTPK